MLARWHIKSRLSPPSVWFLRAWERQAIKGVGVRIIVKEICCSSAQQRNGVLDEDAEGLFVVPYRGINCPICSNLDVKSLQGYARETEDDASLGFS